MKNRMGRGVILTAMLAFGSALQRQASNTAHYQETLEAIDAGSTVVVNGNNNRWYGGTNTVIAFVTNVSYSWISVLHPSKA